MRTGVLLGFSVLVVGALGGAWWISGAGSSDAPPVSSELTAAPATAPANAVAPAAAAAKKKKKEGRYEHPWDAAYTRYYQRVSEDGEIPHDALMSAHRQREALLAAQGEQGVADAGISRARWTWLGPGNIGGRIRPILIHPTDHNLIWVGSCSGGIWASTNAGGRFEPVDDFLPNLVVTAMIFDPFDPSVMYAGTGEGGFFQNPDGSSNTAAVRGAGVFKSTDGGRTWVRLESTSGPEWYQVCRLAGSPTEPDVLLAATGAGIYRSTDGGQTWSTRSAERTLDIRFHPTDGQIAIAGRADGIAQYSSDGGQTWSNATGISGTRVELAFAPSNPTTIYASVSRSGNLFCYRSTDGGRTYAQRGGGFSTLALYDDAIWVHPTNANFVVVGGLELHRSTNGGSNFTRISSWPLAPRSPHADTHAIVQHPAFDGTTNKTVYIGNDGGLYRTDDITTATEDTGWFVMNNNLGVTQFYGAAAGPLSETVVGGTQDNGTLRYRGDPQNWDRIFGGDGTYAAADPTDGRVFYGGSQRLNLFRTDNGGDSTRSIVNGDNSISDRGSSRCNFIPQFALDPNDPNRMLAAARSLWRTNNVKASTVDWFSIKPPAQGCSADPREEPDHEHEHGEQEPRGDHFTSNNPCNISTFAVAPGNSDIVWVAHNRGDVYMTTNGTSGSPTWIRVDENGPLPVRWINSIAISPLDSNRVYVSLMGYEPDNVWRTTDAGQTWEPVVGTGERALPAAPVSWILHHRTKAGWLYAGTDVGIFASEDDGATWSTTNDGPAAVTLDQLFWKDDCTLVAVTHGRGIYRADVCGLCESVSRVKAKCKLARSKLKATSITSLPDGTTVSFILDADRELAATVNAQGKAKAVFKEVSAGNHEVCMKECATRCASTVCE
ncbi:MAG: hypothetical protein FLDDKLPJ_01594 [Phycisphaerae bacterium]|nr:hypothetical protein [Phycisphaerae bacterium]